MNAAVSALAAGVLSSCFSLPFKREPDVQPLVETPEAEKQIRPTPKPKKPAAPVAEANAYYETGAASTSFFVTRPESSRTDRLPDKILRRGTVVQVLVPKAGSGWSKVKLVDAQTGYVPLTDLDIVDRSVRPTGFPKAGSRAIDTRGNLELPEPPTASPSSGTGGDTINLDGDLETPSRRTLPTAPDASDPSGIDSISLDNLPGV